MSVRFKDLGLVVIDEEQRFGVEHKETLKALRTNVDVLAMSATPIPRTLEMAVTGIREMSTLATPPEERHPVLTFVGAYEEKQISAAIRRELLREGQVFYVHNRVESIERTASRLNELVPEARIAVAHGKMGEHRLEQVIVDFWDKRFDVLVCTTIVETGLDISNANTLILERADLLGLSQLHQLRGRVGRGRERAYAYFLYPPEKPLTETAHDRLQTIAAQHRPRRGHGRGDEGPRDPRRRQPARRRAVRAHRGRRLRPVRADGRRGGRGVPRRRRRGAAGRHDRAARRRARPARLHRARAAAPRGVPQDRRRDRRDRAARGARRARRPVRPGARRPSTTCSRSRSSGTHARAAGLADVTAQGKFVRFAPVDLPESAQLRLKRLYPGSVLKPAVRTVLVPFPTTARIGGKPLHGREVLTWARQFIDAIVRGDVSAAADGGHGGALTTRATAGPRPGARRSRPADPVGHGRPRTDGRASRALRWRVSLRSVSGRPWWRLGTTDASGACWWRAAGRRGACCWRGARRHPGDRGDGRRPGDHDGRARGRRTTRLLAGSRRGAAAQDVLTVLHRTNRSPPSTPVRRATSGTGRQRRSQARQRCCDRPRRSRAVRRGGGAPRMEFGPGAIAVGRYSLVVSALRDAARRAGGGHRVPGARRRGRHRGEPPVR